MKISESMRNMVIKEWLKGNYRDRIAVQTGLSGGTVSNIIREWRDRLGNYEVEEMREFSVMCRKAGITPSQCVPAFRAFELQRKMGFDEDDIQFFTSRFYLSCKEFGLNEGSVALLVADLMKLSEKVPIDQLQGYIEESKKEKERLEKAVEMLRADVAAMQNRQTVMLNEYNAVLSEIMLTRSLKEELGKHGMNLNNISKLVQTIQHISDMDFDANQIISRVSTIETMEKKQADLQADIRKQEERSIKLQKTNNILLNSVDSHRQLLSVYQQLQYMGLGLRELDLLFKTITEISRENGFSLAMAVTKFIDDVINHYKHVVGFESRIQELKEESEHIQWEVAILRSTPSDLERAIDATGKLLSLGLDLTEIVQLAKNPEKGTINNELDHHQASCPPKSDTQENKDNIVIGRDSFEQLKEPEQKLPFITESEHEFVVASNHLKTGLVTQVLWIAYAKEVRAQIQEQILWAYCCACVMFDQFQVSKNVLEKQKELLPLAASIKGEAVPLNDLKRSVTIAIQTIKKVLKRSAIINDSKSEAAAVTVLHNAEIALQQLI
jgi:hypothetical protein